MSVLADLCYQWQVVHQPYLTRLIAVNTVGLSGIHLVTIHQHGSGGFRGQFADIAAMCNLVDAAGSGGKQSIMALTQRPTDIVDGGNAMTLPRSDAE